MRTGLGSWSSLEMFLIGIELGLMFSEIGNGDGFDWCGFCSLEHISSSLLGPFTAWMGYVSSNRMDRVRFDLRNSNFNRRGEFFKLVLAIEGLSWLCTSTMHALELFFISDSRGYAQESTSARFPDMQHRVGVFEVHGARAHHCCPIRTFLIPS